MAMVRRPITAAGLAIIGLTGSGAARPQRSSLAALIAVEAAVFAVGAALLAISAHAAHPVPGRRAAARPGCRRAVRRLRYRDQVPHPRGGRVHTGSLSPWTATALLAGAIAFYASARSLQIGPAVEVIALTSVAANLVAIMGGIVVFDEPIGSGPLRSRPRFVAFCLVISPARRSCPPTPSSSSPARARRRRSGRRSVALGWRPRDLGADPDDLWDGLQRPVRRLDALRGGGDPREVALEPRRRADEQIARSTSPRLASVWATAGATQTRPPAWR